MAKLDITNPGKPIEGEAPDKDYLKKLQKKIKLHNQKYPTAPLVTPGGAANVFGYPINGAFFNRAMGHEVDADELTPSTTGLADSSSDSTAEGSGESSGASDAGAVGGGDGGAIGGGDGGAVGGGVGESLRDTFDLLNLSEGVKIGDYMSETEYKDFLELEIKVAKEHLNDPSSSPFIKDFYEQRVRECQDALKKLESALKESIELDKEDAAKDNLIKVIENTTTKDWDKVIKVLRKYSKLKFDFSMLSNLEKDFEVSADRQYDLKSIVDDLQDETLSNTILLSDLSHISTAVKYFVENNFASSHPDRLDEIVEILEGAVIDHKGEKELAILYAKDVPDNDAQRCLDEILSIASVNAEVNFIEAKEEEDSLNESWGNDDKLFFKAYITNLGKYNEGELVGEYVEFPIDEDDFEEKLKEIGIGSTDEFGQPYEEWFVTDYETNTGISLGEYVSYDELNKIGEMIENINDQHLAETFQNAIEALGDYDIESIAEAVIDGDIIFYDGITTDSDLGYELIEKIYGDDIPKDLIESYFDFEALGRDLRIEYYAEDDDMPETAGEYWCGDENASDSDIGWAYYDAVGGEVSNPENYFDYEAYGHDCSLGEFTFTKEGCIEDRR